jgi:hypothetical protein
MGTPYAKSATWSWSLAATALAIGTGANAQRRQRFGGDDKRALDGPFGPPN